MVPAVLVDKLQKNYGSVPAVKEISFKVQPGEIFGLLGPNGAGKTTTIRCICTLAKPDGGNLEVCGISVLDNPKGVRRQIGYVAQEVALDKILTGRELLELQANLYHIPSTQGKQRITELIELLGLVKYAEQKTGTYSGGLRRRLDLAAGLLHQPQVLILDEPSVGLDIESRQVVWDFLRQLQAQGTTILISSHYLEEIDALCDRLIIIDQGKVIAQGTPNELKEQIGGDRLTLRLKEFATVEEAEQATQALKTLPFIQEIITNQAQGNSLNLVVTPEPNSLTQIEKTLAEANFSIFSMTQSRPSLDDVYLAATGKTLMDAELAARGTRDLKSEQKQQMK